MKIVTKKMSFFGDRNDVLSAVDRLVHAESMVSEMELDEDLYGK
ncbi:MAG: hypothetical protein SWX82_20345 [Cyanobacteriota bacterium]|nr:hypothetical protein [Cyanobacteriota bacterium]